MAYSPNITYLIVRSNDGVEGASYGHDEFLEELKEVVEDYIKETHNDDHLEVIIKDAGSGSWIKGQLADQLQWWDEHKLNEGQNKSWHRGMQEAIQLLRSNPSGQ